MSLEAVSQGLATMEMELASCSHHGKTLQDQLFTQYPCESIPDSNQAGSVSISLEVSVLKSLLEAYSVGAVVGSMLCLA